MPRNSSSRILFLTQTSSIGASARYRVYQYLGFLQKNGLDCQVSPSVEDNVFNSYNNRPTILDKANYYFSIVKKRFLEIGRVSKFDCVFLQRDCLVHTYPFIEHLIARKQKNIIFDFDDAIYLYPSNKNPGLFFNIMWDRKKMERIIKLSKFVIAGNHFLKEYAENFTDNVTVIPTSIDLDYYEMLKVNPRSAEGKINIGWIGSQGTLHYLESIFSVFKELAKRYNIQIIVVGAKGPSFREFRIIYKDWSLDTEIKDMGNFDIGVMPLSEDEWSRGKSGTKILQYMAMGIPVVASSVGVNSQMISDGENGFLADTESEWMEKISRLIENIDLGNKFSKNARLTVEKDYSVVANAPKLLKVIKQVINYG